MPRGMASDDGGYERPQTDVEWHADILETIVMRQESTNDYLKDIAVNIEHIKCALVENRSPSPAPLKQTPPTPAWQFFISWAVIIVLFLIYNSK